MTKITSLLAAAMALLSASLATLPAQAQLMRTFVSAASGNDSTDCSLATPCRSFQGAHDKTLDQGEITVLDPGGYGTVTISKSISIVNDGVGEASILVSGGATGITINGGTSTSVNLRGLTVQGIGFGGSTGLVSNGGFALTITKCVFRNHTGDGVRFVPKPTGTHRLSISNSLTADNGNMGIGISLGFNATGVVAQVAIDRVRMVNNSRDGMLVDGTAALGTINVSVTESVSANNGREGFFAFSTREQAAVNLLLVRSVSANNRGAGLDAAGGGVVALRVGQSIITGNARTFAIAGATLQSFGDNYIAGNADGDPALPGTIAKK